MYLKQVTCFKNIPHRWLKIIHLLPLTLLRLVYGEKRVRCAIIMEIKVTRIEESSRSRNLSVIKLTKSISINLSRKHATENI